MFPGMDPRMVKQAMKKMGMEQKEIEATEVIIKTPDKEIVFSNPSVQKVKMMNEESWQISGEYEERSLDTTPEINEDDISTVIEQTEASKEDVIAAIEKNNGDLAAAIMELKKE
jgi:nascent polypeptide-associated complex subunit alpha